MKKFKFKKIDAFATEFSAGNPAGYIWLENAEAINEAEMQRIAKELKGFVNEVGFIYQKSTQFFELKYYSSEREVDFCGHATIAIMYDLIKNNAQLQQYESITIQTNRGELLVENRILKEEAVFIMSPLPEEKFELPSKAEIASNLRLEQAMIDDTYPLKIINAGLNTLIVPIKSLKSILKLEPDLEELKTFCIKAGIDIIEVFTPEVADAKHDYRVRVFAPTFGYLEDPATGSGNSAFGYYLSDLKIWSDQTLLIEQNGFMNNYNLIKLQTKTDETGANRVLFGGSAITRIDGEYIIY